MQCNFTYIAERFHCTPEHLGRFMRFRVGRDVSARVASGRMSVHTRNTATENVHALEGLACCKRADPASSPAAPASRVRRWRRIRPTLAAAPGILAHALVAKQKKLTIYSDAMPYSVQPG